MYAYRVDGKIVKKSKGSTAASIKMITVEDYKNCLAWHFSSLKSPLPYTASCSASNVSAENCCFRRSTAVLRSFVKDQLVNIAQTITMLGILVGNFIFGILSDNNCIYSMVWAFLILRFISAAATGGTMVTSFVLVMEIIGTKWRTTLGILYQIPFNLGHLSLALIGYFIPIKVMEKARRFNKIKANSIKDDVDVYMKKRSTEQAKGKFMDLVSTKNMRIKSICIFYNWIVCGLCFFGGAQYMGQLGGNIFVNIALSSVIQIPGTIFSIWFMEFFGRRYTLMGSDLLAGYLFFNQVLGSLGMFGLSFCFPTVYIYSGELYPTVIRNIGVGTSSMFARVGSMLAPFIAGLATYESWLAPAIFGIVPLIGAALCYHLPETKNCKLPETLEDAEKFVRNGKASIAPIPEATLQVETRT
ncbi:hypothetical protein RI129_000196 [Pyrocoelia pectoralis]|uniref:Organic cation transporter n=1 Tax=Pyrocoelia pectoralis TaxID=417401 RepID=A0AAN7ZBN2_9COLE